MHAIVINGQATLVRGAFTDAGGVKHPAQVLTLWTSEELRNIDVYPVVDEPISSGHRVVSWTLSVGDDAVYRHFVTEPAPPPPAPPVPEEVTKRKAMLALYDLGLYAAIHAFIDAIEDEAARDRVRLELEAASTISRQHPLVLAFAQHMGLTDEQLDDLFRAAQAIPD